MTELLDIYSTQYEELKVDDTPHSLHKDLEGRTSTNRLKKKSTLSRYQSKEILVSVRTTEASLYFQYQEMSWK